ncbi:MAG: ATP-binding protein [Thermacetogeniaceae bacterium]|jgi:PAS domain S-box-containing protein
MGIYSAQTAIELYRVDERVPDVMPRQVHEETGFGSECSPEQLREHLQELVTVNQAMEKKLLEHRKREAGLRKDLLDYRLLAEVSPAFIYIIQGSRLRLVNPCSHDFAGYTARELKKVDLWMLIHPDFREIIKERYEAHRRGEVSASTFSVKIISKTGQEKRVEIETRTIACQGEPAVLVALRDISEHKRKEEMLAPPGQGEDEFQSQAGLFQARKMEAVGRLAGGMAHELNNQLTVICACVDLFLPGLSMDNPLHRALSRIRNSALICANLTRQLLLFSCRFPLFKVPTDLNQRVEELGKMLPHPRRVPRPEGTRAAPAEASVDRARLGGNIDIRLETCPHLWKVNADTAALDQAIANLVLNARDAMPNGGTLTIKTENVAADRSGQAGVVPGRFVCLSVSDTGAGIDEANRSRIFEPFYTTKRPGQGIGLGLPVAYGIIRAHGGWIEVDSAPGRGSTFRINLPAFSTGT